MHCISFRIVAISAIALICVAGCLFGTANARKSASDTVSAGDPGVITVDGIATMQVVPDVVDVAMTLAVEKPRPKAAVAALRKQRGVLIDRLVSAGMNRGKLKISHLDLRPVYEQHGSEVRGYEASLTIIAEVADFDRIGDVMEAGASADASRMWTRFYSTELPKLKKKVRDLALKAAKDKARQMSDAMGVRIGKVVALSEGQTGSGWNFGRSAVANEFVPAPSTDRTLPGAQPLSLTVNASFAIVQ